MLTKKPRIVIAGQVPPPYGGQNIMIQRSLTQFAGSEEWETVHLTFHFTPEMEKARGAGPAKVVELLRVLLRLLRIRCGGEIDLLLYPTGGPQTVPIIRDLLLLPWILLLSDRVVLHFHAGGIADRFAQHPRHPLALACRLLYAQAHAAVVMTEFNRRDPQFCGIERVLVIPHRIEDEFDPALVDRNGSSAPRLLYVGHLCADKGTPQLLRAFAAVAQDYPRARLELVGECLPPFDPRQLEDLLRKLELGSKVVVSGVLTGPKKAAAYARADLFVFPTIAPYESFGLVLVEAMMWALPIVTSDWRGNRDVLTPAAGAIVFPVTPPLEKKIEQALRGALAQIPRWAGWGTNNRKIFEQRYRTKEGERWLVQGLAPLFAEGSGTLKRKA